MSDRRPQRQHVERGHLADRPGNRLVGAPVVHVLPTAARLGRRVPDLRQAHRVLGDLAQVLVGAGQWVVAQPSVDQLRGIISTPPVAVKTRSTGGLFSLDTNGISETTPPLIQ
jgi:hypothetical protein